MTQTFALAIHGGAGTIRRASMTAETEAGYRAGLRTALLAGHGVLADGGSAVEAVTRAVMALEDDPHFNSGRGAVFTTDGRQEMDAAIMDGRDRAAGAVAGIMGPRNPILAARAVMERSEQVLLIGQGALDFCRAQGVVFADADYFYTEPRWQALRAELRRRREGAADTRDDAARHGTVGAVARDAQGNLAAATSTGGMTAKPPGRVGDSPIFGAGTWAEKRRLCHLRHRSRRVLHPVCGRARNCRPHPPGRAKPGAGGRRRHCGTRSARRFRWPDRGRRGRTGGAALQLVRDVSRSDRWRRCSPNSDLPGRYYQLM